MRQKEKNIQAEVKAGVVKNYMPVGLSVVAAQNGSDSLVLQDETPNGGIRLSMATSANIPTTAINHTVNNSQDRLKSDCINLATNSQQELSQEGGAGITSAGIRRSTKSASRVRVEGGVKNQKNNKNRNQNDEILTYDNTNDNDAYNALQ